MRKFNDWLAIKITDVVGSMWCAYIFTAIALISLPSAIATHNLITIVSWVAQTFLQLVLLSVILKGQNIQGERSEKVIARIDDNTDKTELIVAKIENNADKIAELSEQMANILKIIEKDTEKELKDIEKNKLC